MVPVGFVVRRLRLRALRLFALSQSDEVTEVGQPAKRGSMSDDKRAFPLAVLRVEGALQNMETGRVITDPVEIAEYKRRRDAENERIRLLNEEGVIRFSSGRVMEPNAGVVGLDHELEVHEGFDNHLFIMNADARCWAEPSTADMRELADLMIDRWTRFKASLEGKSE